MRERWKRVKELVVVGNGLAGMRLVSEVLKRDPLSYHVTVFGSEPYLTYDRIRLSQVLAGEVGPDEILVYPREWYEAHHVDVYTANTAQSIDKVRQTVTGSGVSVRYDELVLATGSRPAILPIPGSDLKGVYTFRDIGDCDHLIDAAPNTKRAVVIGGGLLGLEVAKGLIERGVEVIVVHLPEHLMERQLDKDAAYLLQRELETQGMTFLMNRRTVLLRGSTHVEGLQFDDGEIVLADMVVMALGITPETSLARNSGILVRKGIIVDNLMRTSVPHIYAVGECAEWEGRTYGTVAPLFEQAKVLADVLTSTIPQTNFNGYPESTKLKVAGISLVSMGDFQVTPERDVYMMRDARKRHYKKVVFEDGRLVGALLLGDDSWSVALTDMMQHGASFEEFEKFLANPTVTTSAAELPNDSIICGCNGVNKSTIIESILEKRLTSTQEVTFHTGAARSCGGCRPLVQQILENVNGPNHGSEIKETICDCTSMSRDEVVELIRSKHLTTVSEVMSVGQWLDSHGCPKCRPELNYYLKMIWPEDHREVVEDRLVNERMHANIQKDGTFSVVPRIYGGVITAEQLMNIAQVAMKYNVPLIKITGGQRLDLLGVNKEELPDIWSDLKMPSGHAYAKGFRTVKTCVGTDFCRFGTQDAISTGIHLEKHFEGLDMPHKVKMAVSGCPRNCAEATIKDVGIIGVEGGFDIMVAGNGGTKVRSADHLARVTTLQEVTEWSSAFIQYYREEARYRERTSHWVDRVGMDSIRAHLSSEKVRQALVDRLNQARKGFQEPWSQIVSANRENGRYEVIRIGEETV